MTPVEKARRLRKESTPAEKILWSILRDRRLQGFKFRRQQPLGPYVVDFFCAQLRLILELDGESHVGREHEDAARQQWLEQQGIRVLRFWNPDIYDDREAVLESIWQTCTALQGR
ncbi:MAG: endonuclease domain-containing protein [Planctomycetia bacterium]|nr:endonuclease domain-containing protein [Planctomycetia bacterium]